MNCGGSDANSGISANPALGVASDQLVRQGAASVFGETTEIYGAEHLLTRRAVTREVGRNSSRRPAGGNSIQRCSAQPLTTIPRRETRTGVSPRFLKRASAQWQGGPGTVVRRLRLPEQIEVKGLCFMDTPGNDR
ncbi:MAG: hypothetical protein CM1200mP29_10440 [Verrucomicrobiota bacterium]|nr:MAG: hypothetical protein CM1200mP29_10440 [Verrucomicrobiota bacterium]